MYSKKDILIATIISLVILLLCVGLVLTGIFMASIPTLPTPTSSGPVPLSVSTEDIINTYAATLIGTGSAVGASSSQFSANVQYVLDTSAIACLVVLIIILGVIIWLDYYNRKKGK